MVAKAASSKRASKRTLNAENLKTLGAPRLAELLMDLTENDPAAKRRLRLELAAADSPAAVARLARTRLGNLAKAKTNIGWKQMPALYREMEAHHDIIVRTAKEVPALGLELLWLFIAAATSVRDRCGFDPGSAYGSGRALEDLQDGHSDPSRPHHRDAPAWCSSTPLMDGGVIPEHAGQEVTLVARIPPGDRKFALGGLGVVAAGLVADDRTSHSPCASSSIYRTVQIRPSRPWRGAGSRSSRPASDTPRRAAFRERIR